MDNEGEQVPMTAQITLEPHPTEDGDLEEYLSSEDHLDPAPIWDWDPGIGPTNWWAY